MATIAPGAYTYTEWALRTDSTGKVSKLVDLLSQNNGILYDMLAVECQSGNAYEYTQVVKLPTPTKRVYNQGVPASLAGVGKLITTAVEYADWAKFDASLLQLGGNLAARRYQEVALHMEGMSQTVASDLFYANRATDPTAFTGLANIYNTISTGTSAIANNVIDGAGVGADNTSMWLVVWGVNKIHTIFPNGTQAGLQHTPYDILPTPDSNNNNFPAYQDYLQWRIGLAIEDWRYAVRACNIDVSDLATATPANLINLLVKMCYRVPSLPGVININPGNYDSMVEQMSNGMPVIYCNRTVMQFLELQAMNKTNVLLQMREWMGQMVPAFRGIPIRVCDAITNAETRVV